MLEWKELKKAGFLTSFIYALFGLLLLLWPEISFKMICDLLGVLCVITGLVQMISYYIRDHRESLFRNDFALGLIMLVIGIVLLTNAEMVIGILPIVLGIFLLVSSAFKLQSALDLRLIGFDKWWVILVMAAASAALGSIMVWNPFETSMVLLVYVGICFVVDGVTGLVTQFLFLKKVKHYLNAMEEAGRNADRRSRRGNALALEEKMDIMDEAEEFHPDDRGMEKEDSAKEPGEE